MNLSPTALTQESAAGNHGRAPFNYGSSNETANIAF